MPQFFSSRFRDTWSEICGCSSSQNTYVFMPMLTIGCGGFMSCVGLSVCRLSVFRPKPSIICSLSVVHPLTPILCEVIPLYLVETLQWHLPHIFITWIGIAERFFKVKRSKSWADQMLSWQWRAFCAVESHLYVCCQGFSRYHVSLNLV